jgi:hypothetical protein
VRQTPSHYGLRDDTDGGTHSHPALTKHNKKRRFDAIRRNRQDLRISTILVPTSCTKRKLKEMHELQPLFLEIGEFF